MIGSRSTRRLAAALVILSLALSPMAITAQSAKAKTAISAVKKGDWKAAAKAIAAINPDVPLPAAPDASTLLHPVIVMGEREIMSALLAKGADPEKRNMRGLTALQQAFFQKDAEAVRILLDAGASHAAVNPKDGGKTVLHYAAISGLVDEAKLLIEKGADVNALDSVKANPLNWAAWKGSLEMVKLMLDSGGDLSNKDSFGDTPLSAAKQNPDPAVQAYLQGLAK